MLLCGRCVGHLTYTTGGAAECSSCPDGQVANWDKSGCGEIFIITCLLGRGE